MDFGATQQEPHRGQDSIDKWRETLEATLPSQQRGATGKKKDGRKANERQSERKGGKGAEAFPVLTSLNHRQKLLIVELFACFEELSDIQMELARVFRVCVPLDRLKQCDPSTRYCKLGQRYRDHFAAVRKEYVESAASVSLSHQAHRMRRYERIASKAEADGEYGQALKALELAAKEMGGVLAGQSTVKHEGKVIHEMTVAEARMELAMRLQSVVDGGTLLPIATLPPPEEGAVEVVQGTLDP